MLGAGNFSSCLLASGFQAVKPGVVMMTPGQTTSQHYPHFRWARVRRPEPVSAMADVGAASVTVCARFRPENDVERDINSKAVSFAEVRGGEGGEAKVAYVSPG